MYNDFLQKKGMVSESYIQLKRDRVQIAAGSEQIVTALSEEQVEKLLFYVRCGSFDSLLRQRGEIEIKIQG